MKRKIGINSDCIYGQDDLKTIDIIKETGFNCFFTSRNVTDFNAITALKKRGDALGLSFEFLHAPFKDINSIWQENENTKPFMKSIFQTIDNASLNAIPIIILHVSSGWNPPTETEEGLARYDELVAYGEKKKVYIAIENQRLASRLDTLMSRYKNCPYVSFCYDNGHEHCWSPEISHIEKYGGKMNCTHLHDNFGKLENYLNVCGDLHLLPLDGNFDYIKMIRKMNKCGYTGALTLEVFNNRRSNYENMSAHEFVYEAYVRLKKLSEM